MSAVPPTPRVKLRTATRRVPRARPGEADTSATLEAEPNMRLSRAILVMLLLHVFAVGGILAFSLVKERGHSHAATNPASNAVEAEDTDVPPAKAELRDTEHAADTGAALPGAQPVHPANLLTRVSNDPTAANDAAARIAGGRPNVANPAAGTTAPASEKNGRVPADSGKTYVVQKGENLSTVAEKLKVDPAALLKLNGIDDPKKLKSGQTLHVPAVTRAKTK